MAYDPGFQHHQHHRQHPQKQQRQPQLRRPLHLDQLKRLIRAEEGTLSWSGGTGSISNRSRDERWQDASNNLALSQTGNWLRRRLDLNGDGAFTGTGELDDTGAFSLANELKTRDTDSSGTPNYTLAYDKSGNQTDDGKDYTYVYDAFGRLRQVKNRSDSSLVAEYRYNGLSFRIGWHYDSDADKDVDSADPWYYFCYDDAWRVVATFRAGDADPKEVFVHHNAGLGGYGGSSYIDSVVLRDRDANSGWTSAADSTREERRYSCQNWRADVSAILTDAGSMIEWVKYSSYGVPFALPAGDTDSDGDWDATDSGRISTSSSYDVRQDTNLDGAIGAADITHANSITGGYQTLGRGRLSSSAVDNRKGYAGYEYDPTLEGAGRHLYHVRFRVYDADVGRWTRRDPLGYVDSTNLYEFVFDSPLIYLDPDGLQAQPLPVPTGPGLPSSPIRFPGDPTIPFKFPTPRPTPLPRPLPPACPKPGPAGPIAICFLVGEVFYCIGEEISPWIFPPIDPPVPPLPRKPDRRRCTQSRLDQLQKIVNRDCKTPGLTGACRSSMSCDDLLRLEAANRQCCVSRNRVLDCFKPKDRDPGHKWEANRHCGMANNCRFLASNKGCFGNTSPGPGGGASGGVASE